MSKQVLEIPVLNEKLFAELQSLDKSYLRDSSWNNFLQSGFPSVKHEEWRFTPLENSLKKIQKISSADSVSLPAEAEKIIASLEPIDAYKIIVVNGKPVSVSAEIDGTVSFPFGEGIRMGLFGKYLTTEKETFNALNTALTNDGVFIHLKKNSQTEKPIHIISVHDNREEGIYSTSRILIVAEEGAKAHIVETHISTAEKFSLQNLGAEIIVKQNARIEYHLIQHFSLLGKSEASVIDSRQVVLEKDSFCNFTTVSMSGALIRNNLHMLFNAQNGEGHLYGLYLPSKNELMDNHSLVDHAMPNCFSNEFYKGIMTENGKGVFNGKIMVRKDAQKTNAYQNNRNLLLSDDAGLNAKPQLEIFADDVKCSHGATSGQLDEDAMFYLRARGIGEMEAKKLLTLAFAEDVLVQTKHEGLHNQIDKWIEKKLSF
ncbi:Fe-S cluster assembly protein SufD [Bacteroidota bacterium]|nr:Fe-S cluster assembly protein SufD [Bacteroidota bacterium]